LEFFIFCPAGGGTAKSGLFLMVDCERGLFMLRYSLFIIIYSVKCYHYME